jgi:hypothetical protein
LAHLAAAVFGLKVALAEVGVEEIRQLSNMLVGSRQLGTRKEKSVGLGARQR